MFPIVDYVRPAVEHLIGFSSIGFAPLLVCFLVKWEIGCKCSKAKEESAWLPGLLQDVGHQLP